MYATGRGVPKNDTEAVRWYKMAAEQGDSEGQHGLGTAYANGQGVLRDYVIAYKWLLLAAATKESARDNVQAVEKMLNSEQRAEGQKLARDFKPVKWTPIKKP